MMTIDAVGKDGASILPDLQHSSPRADCARPVARPYPAHAG